MTGAHRNPAQSPVTPWLKSAAVLGPLAGLGVLCLAGLSGTGQDG